MLCIYLSLHRRFGIGKDKITSVRANLQLMVLHESTGRFGAVDKPPLRAESRSDLAQCRPYQYSIMERAVSRPYKRSPVGRHALVRKADQAESHGGAQSGGTVAGADQAGAGGDTIGCGHVAGGRGRSGGALSYSAIEPGIAEHLIQNVEAEKKTRNFSALLFNDLVNMPSINTILRVSS